MMTLASEPPMNRRRSSRIFSLHCVFKDFLHQEIAVIVSPRDPIQGRVAHAGLDWSIAGLSVPGASVKTPSIDLRHRASLLSTVERLRSLMEAAGLAFVPETGCGVGVRLHEPGLKKNKKFEEPTNRRADWMELRGCAFPSSCRDPNSRTRSAAFRLTMLFLPKPNQPSLVGADNEVAA
jgi:hypothetical protein